MHQRHGGKLWRTWQEDKKGRQHQKTVMNSTQKKEKSLTTLKCARSTSQKVRPRVKTDARTSLQCYYYTGEDKSSRWRRLGEDRSRCVNRDSSCFDFWEQCAINQLPKINGEMDPTTTEAFENSPATKRKRKNFNKNKNQNGSKRWMMDSPSGSTAGVIRANE